MDLKTLFLSLSEDERQKFAGAVGCSVGHLKNVMYGYKACAPELAAEIEHESRTRYGDHQTVMRWDLIPDRWQRIWPELVGVEGAPNIAQQQRVA